jgi:hypothetical protein
MAQAVSSTVDAAVETAASAPTMNFDRNMRD